MNASFPLWAIFWVHGSFIAVSLAYTLLPTDRKSSLFPRRGLQNHEVRTRFSILSLFLKIECVLFIILFISFYHLKGYQKWGWHGSCKEIPINIYCKLYYPSKLFKVNNRNTRTRCEICSKLIIKIS